MEESQQKMARVEEKSSQQEEQLAKLEEELARKDELFKQTKEELILSMTLSTPTPRGLRMPWPK